MINNLMSHHSALYVKFSRKEWTILQNSIPLTSYLNDSEILKLKTISKNLSIKEIIEIYLPLTYLLNFYIISNIKRQKILKQFLCIKNQRIPYVIGITGSVAVGKSTTARILQILLSRWSKHRVVELVNTDCFLYSNQTLKERNLMKKKGFPESYNICELINFISKIKSGISNISIPIYSHLIYDILPKTKKIILQPDILILEGLNILQNNNNQYNTFISDFIDFSIYVDAPENLLQSWYLERFLKLRHDSFSNPNSYFYNYSKLSKQKVLKIANQCWNEINSLNLQQNILPTRERAKLIFTKSIHHYMNGIFLRK